MSREMRRVHLEVRGAVQGVGFRPHVYRLARKLGLSGWIVNGGDGVHIEVEGRSRDLLDFERRITDERPPLAVIESITSKLLPRAGYEDFLIRPSQETGDRSVTLLPDLAVCRDCLQDMANPSDRRHRYPFTNCTGCGPRFSIVEELPYDRSRTSMRHFAMCDACHHEYEDPSSRRFHAQPNSCPACGPTLSWLTPGGSREDRGDLALARAVERLRHGDIVAVKGIGGYHLMADAVRDDTIERLRGFKGRDSKPFAVMIPAESWIDRLVHASPLERSWLGRPEAPIVILDRTDSAGAWISPSVAPGLARLALFLPYTPLHHLLLEGAGRPLVATSGNVADEPIVIDEITAIDRLGAMVAGLLVHDRPIVNRADDSVVQIAAGEPMVLRRARGFAPAPLRDPAHPVAVTATGAHQKNTVALGWREHIYLSPHIGDLDSVDARRAHGQQIDRLQSLYRARPRLVGHDLHPDHASTQLARGRGEPTVGIQHHHAHVVSVMVEHGLPGPVLGVAWDGTGLGTDGTSWGGEFLVATRLRFGRVACLRRFRLPGGNAAAREPWRSALGVLHEGGLIRSPDPALHRLRQAVSPRALAVLERMMDRGTGSPWTSSAGRLFDAVAAIVGLRSVSKYEAQAAIELEALARGSCATTPYSFAVSRDPSDPTPLDVLDWTRMIPEILQDLTGSRSLADIASRFHHTLAAMIESQVRCRPDLPVVLAGGCFQNRLLLEATLTRLSARDARTYWSRMVPPNDGGIALGQAGILRARGAGHVPGDTR